MKVPLPSLYNLKAEVSKGKKVVAWGEPLWWVLRQGLCWFQRLGPALGLPEESRHVPVWVLLVVWLVGKPGFLVFLVSLVLYLKPEPKQNEHSSV